VEISNQRWRNRVASLGKAIAWDYQTLSNAYPRQLNGQLPRLYGTNYSLSSCRERVENCRECNRIRAGLQHERLVCWVSGDLSSCLWVCTPIDHCSSGNPVGNGSWCEIECPRSSRWWNGGGNRLRRRWWTSHWCMRADTANQARSQEQPPFRDQAHFSEFFLSVQSLGKAEQPPTAKPPEVVRLLANGL